MNESVAARRIRVLSQGLANQIAAGEVVERPASVVKELLENSLDAGATRLEVEAERGGVRLIRVRDDGHGIEAEDLSLALARHATSKIASLQDLEAVTTLGFRGEALPSIASISRLGLSSRVAQARSGWRVRADGVAPPTQPEPVPHPPGTTVEVHDLFHNTPARRRFLRSERTELRHLEGVVRRVAMSHPEVTVSLSHDQRRVFSVAAARDDASRARRLARLCGAAFAEAALQVEFESGTLRLTGFVGAPGYARAQADLQHFFVNRRMVRDPVTLHAVRQAYQELLPQGRHPAYVLYLDLDPGELDVNVHPTKHEVRFREARLVHDFVLSALKRALGTRELGLAAHGEPAGGDARHPLSAAAADSPGPRLGEAAEAYAALYGTPAGGETERREEAPQAEPPHPLGRALGVVGGRYVLAERAEGLILVDVRAARCHLAQARLEAALAAGDPSPRPLLLPVSVAVGRAQAARVEAEGPRLARLGLDLAPSGPDTVCLRAVPAPLADVDPETLVHTLVPILGEDAGDSALVRALAAAAGGAPAPGPAQAEALLRELEGAGGGAGEGRGVWLTISMDEVARRLRGAG